MNEEMYEEEDDDVPVRFEELRNDLSITTQSFRRQLSEYVRSVGFPDSPSSVYLPEQDQQNLSSEEQARRRLIIEEYRVGHLRAAQRQQIQETTQGICRSPHPVAREFQALRDGRQQLPSEICLDEMRRVQTEHMRALSHEGYIPESLPGQLFPTSTLYSPRLVQHPLDLDDMAPHPMAQYPLAQQPAQTSTRRRARYSPHRARGSHQAQRELPVATLDISPLDYLADVDFECAFLSARPRQIPIHPLVGSSMPTVPAADAGSNRTSTCSSSELPTGSDASAQLINTASTFGSASTVPPSMREEISPFTRFLTGTPITPSNFLSPGPIVDNESGLQENRPVQARNEATLNPGTSFPSGPLAEALLAQVNSNPLSGMNQLDTGELGVTPDSIELMDSNAWKAWLEDGEWEIPDEEL